MTDPIAESPQFATILQALSYYSESAPDFVVYTWVDNSCTETHRKTYRELDEESDAVAAHLLQQGCKKGDRVMIAYPFGLEFVAGLFGAMKVGVIPCSIYPPDPRNPKTSTKQFRTFVKDAGAKIALSSNAFATAMKALGIVFKSDVKWIGTDGLPKISQSRKQSMMTSYSANGSDVAFIQYSSGSTGFPKGVLIGHQALVENCRALVAVTDTKRLDICVMWVPQYHDMGLISGFMASLYANVKYITASPIDFISRPLLWADMVEKYKASFTSAPTFAYALLLKRLKQANRKSDWSHLKRAMFGGEPVRADVVEKVIQELKVKPEHVYNMYGLAEGIALLTGGPATSDEDGIVMCGPTHPGEVSLCIVKDGQQIPDGEVGNIWAQSPYLASGYYGKEDLTVSTFRNTLPGRDDHWLDTGDLGRVVNGKLFATGRAKDVIIVNGKNFYPTDIEASVDHVFGETIRPGRSAAFQLGDATIGIVVEPRKMKAAKSSGIDRDIMNHTLQYHGLVVQAVLVLSPGAVPKTTSGKLRRAEIQKRTREGSWASKDILILNEIKKPSGPDSRDVSIPKNERGTSSLDAESRFFEFLSEALDVEPVMERTWAENGLSSIASASLVNVCQHEFQVEIPVNFAEVYTTPAQLQRLVLSSTGTLFSKDDHKDGVASSPTLSKHMLGLFQLLGILSMFVLVAASLLPSFFLGRAISCQTITFQIGDSGRYAQWNWLPIIVPAFFVTFSIVVVTCKKILIGTYKAEVVSFYSRGYLCWWFQDRLMDIWELLVGQFILETKLLVVFYRLLGADLSMSASVGAFIREPDLMTIGPRSLIEYPLKSRKFRLWKDTESSPTMVLRSVQIGGDCVISGLVEPGCCLGSRCKVECLSYLSEGSIVPDGAIAIGAPAYGCGQTRGIRNADTLFEVLKILWLPVEVYLYFSLFLASQVLLNDRLPQSWRYSRFLYWVLLLILTAGFGVAVSVLLKWTLIGKRQATGRQESQWTKFANWLCDYHYRLAQMTLLPFNEASKFWVIVLKLHGMDIDFASSVNGYRIFIPSTVDLVRVQRSFLSASTFDFCDAKGMIEITDSNLGYNARIHSGVQIIRSLVPARATVKDCIFDSNTKVDADPPVWRVLQLFGNELAQLVLSIVVIFAFVPAFEVFLATGYTGSTGVAMLGVACSLMTQCLCLSIVSRIVETITLACPSWSQQFLFLPYIIHSWCSRVWSLSFLLYGTPFAALWLRLMGAEVKGDLWYFGNELYDISKLHFVGERMILDNCHIAGHTVSLGSGIRIDDTFVHNALVHPSGYACAGTLVADGEHHPFKVYSAATKLENTSRTNHTPKSSVGSNEESEIYNGEVVHDIIEC